MSDKVKRVDRELVYSGSVLDMYQDTMEMPDGNTKKWDFIAHRKGGAAVVPVLPDGRILMIHQYRPAINRATIEIPAGARNDVDEPTVATAKRELREETGYTSKDLRLLLKLKTAVAYCDEFTDVYLAENIEKIGKQKLDEAEDIRVEAFHLKDLLVKIYGGTLQDSKTVAGILAYATLVNERRDGRSALHY
ncbi:MAG: NUDIX hydrolase [Lachnospiraceae bacterium]|nr:NUDIX hydrolase [Lachnospiraceae bacterium]